MNPTPVAWRKNFHDQQCTEHAYAEDAETIPNISTWEPLFTKAQLNQARADALREAAEFVDRRLYDNRTYYEELMKMAAEIEGEMK